LFIFHVSVMKLILVPERLVSCVTIEVPDIGVHHARMATRAKRFMGLGFTLQVQTNRLDEP